MYEFSFSFNLVLKTMGDNSKVNPESQMKSSSLLQSAKIVFDDNKMRINRRNEFKNFLNLSNL